MAVIGVCIFRAPIPLPRNFSKSILSGVFQLPGYQAESAGRRDDVSPDHAFRLFVLLFGRDAFLSAHHGQTLHALVRDQGKHWEAGVAADLSRIVFDELYPELVKAIAAHDPNRDAGLSAEYLSEVQAGRADFSLSAAVRALRRRPSSASGRARRVQRIRADAAARRNRERNSPTARISRIARRYIGRVSKPFSARSARATTRSAFRLTTAVCSNRPKRRFWRAASCPTKSWRTSFFLCRTKRPEPRPKYINYRDLSVQQLGSIYERLLEYRCCCR